MTIADNPHPLARADRPLPGRPDDRLDTTIVNVALPSIREDLGFSESSLAWVVNAYLLTFGGFLLLGGRLGDLFGHRRLFVGGIALFTTASLACGLAGSQAFLVAARAVQGLGGAVVAAVALSLVMTLFTEPDDRAKAMGVIGFVAAGGGSIGVLLGGVLTDALDWHWIFLVNVPIGAVVIGLSLRLLPGGRGARAEGRLDVAGAITVTSALMLAVYAIVNGNEVGWTTVRHARPARRGRRAARRVLLDRGARVVAAGAARPVPDPQRRDGEHRRRPLVGRDVRVVLPRRPLPPARARVQPAPRSASRSCRRT
jgi:MFS family permease